MAKLCELAEDWNEWVASRPPVVRKMCESHPGNLLYRMKSTKQRVFIIAYAENGTLRVGVSGRYNLTLFEREVFGVLPGDLEECELPAEGEKLGILQTREETEEMIEALRPLLIAMHKGEHNG